MKWFFAFVLLLVSTLSFGQTYNSLIKEADAFYETQQYEKAVDKYRKAFQFDLQSPSNFYNAACAAALAGDKTDAFDWLRSALDAGWTDVRHLMRDPDLVSLRGTKQWNKIVSDAQKIADDLQPVSNKPLRDKLLDIYDADQNIRMQYEDAEKHFGHGSKQTDSLSKIMRLIDSVNLIKVTQILDKYGWLGYKEIGREANTALFLVIQHSDLKTQQKYLPMMRAAVASNNAAGNALALLEDRVALGEGRQQLYGSQIGYDPATKTNYVLPLADPDNVDKRRAEVGLGPIADYVKHWDIIWNADEYKKQLPDIEKKSKR